MQGNFKWSQRRGGGGGWGPSPPFGFATTNNNQQNKNKNKSQSEIKPPSKIRERDVGRFGFLDSAISLYVGQVDGSGDLMECVVKKWWLRGRK